MNSKFLLLLLLGILLSHTSHSQIPQTLDSLELFLKTKPHDSTYTKAMKDCAFRYLYKGQYSRADSLAKQVEILAQEINFTKGVYYHYLIIASIANYKSQSRKSLEFFLKGLEIVEKNNLSKFWLEASLNNVAITYEALGEHENALKYALRAIEVEEKFFVEHLDGSPYDVVGNIYKNAGKFEQALKYFESSLTIETANHDTNPQATQYVNGMATEESNLGSLFEAWGKPKEAKTHYSKGLALVEKVGSKLEQIGILTNLGNIFKSLGQSQQAENYYKRSEKIGVELKDEIGLQTLYAKMGNLYLTQKKNLLSEKYYQKSLQLAQKLKLFENQRDANFDLAKFYAEMQDFKNAYIYSSKTLALKDSILIKDAEKKTQELLTKYEIEKKETQIKLLNEQAKADNFQKSAYLGGGILTVLLAGLLIFSLQNRNTLKQLQDSQRLRNKISSDLHDEIGSTLSSISLLSGMTEERLRKNDSSKAEQMVHRIHQDSQQVMESIDDIIWTVNPKNDSLPQMILRLKAYATPLAEAKSIQLNFQSPLDINAIALSMEIRRNIYLITKEAINNLVKYSNATLASITFLKEGKMLDIQIVDNGKGFDAEVFSDRNGVRNMRERATEMKAQIEIKSVKNEGTKIVLKVPIV